MTVIAPSSVTVSTSEVGSSASLWDGLADSSHRWRATANTATVTFDMGTATPIGYYTLVPGMNSVNEDPSAWTFESSPDNSTWTTLDTKSSQSFTTNSARTFAVTGNDRYYKLNVSAVSGGGSSHCSLSEMQVGSATPGPTIAETQQGTTTGTTTVTATISGTPTGTSTVVVSLSADKTATVTGLGATWTKVRDGMAASASTYTHVVWVGTGASSGTVTATAASNFTAQMVVLVVDNLTQPLVYAQAAYNSTRTVSNGQIVIGAVYESGAGNAVVSASSTPSAGAYTAGTRYDPTGSIRVNQAWKISSTETSHNLIWSGLAFAAGDMLVLGMPAIAGAAPTTGVIATTAPSATAALAGNVTIPGSIAATAPTATAALAGLAYVTGTVAATAPVATAAIAGDSAGSQGLVTATAPVATAAIAGNVATIAIVDAIAPVATAAIAGTALAPITGTIAATAPVARVFITDVPDGAESYAESAGDAGDPLDVDLDTGAEAYAESAGDAGDPISFDTGSIEAYAESWATAVTVPEVTLDPATGRPQYRLKVVDMQGVEQVELPNVAIRDATRSLNGRGGMEFSLPKIDDDVDLVTQFSELQLWRGNQIVPRWGWFVCVDPKIDEGDTSYTYQCSGLSYYLERRIIGKERPELLLNGGFEDGILHWTPSYDAGSNAETPPHWRIVDGRYLPDFGEALTPVEGGKAIQVFAQDKVVVTERVAETAAIFYPNRPYATEALSAGFQPGGEQIIRDLLADIDPPNGATLTVEGHTADADAGTGFALSVRRAEAAKEVILAERPDLTVNTVGKGETEPVDPRHTEAAYKKNRRVVIKGSWTEERVGHRQYIKQSFTYEVAEADREAMEIDVTAQSRIDQWTGPSKDGWMLYVDVRPVSNTATLLEKSTFDVDLTSPRNVWTGISAEVKVPADSDPKSVTVRLYPTAGATSFDQVSAKPNLKLNFYETDPRDIIAGLVTHAQDAAYGKSDLNLTTYGAPVGFRMTKRYPWKDRIKVSEAIDELVRSLNGPDANVEVTGRSRWVVVAAKQGKRTGLTFALGDRTGDAKIDAYAGGIDGDLVATTAITQSSWSGGGMEEVFATLAREDGLVLENAYQAEQDTPRSTLLEHSRTAVKYGLSDVITHVVMSPEDTTYLLEAVDIGDVVTLDVHDSRTQVLADYRIIQINLDPNYDQLTYSVAVEN